MPERAFVLLPLAQIAAGAVHPALARTVADLAAAVPADDVHIVARGDWWA